MPPILGETMSSQDTTPDTPPHHRPIRSFVLREGRLTTAQQRAFGRLWPRFGVDWRREEQLDPAALFGNDRPAYLEIGFGSGDTLAELAQASPECNYLGVEVHRPGVGHLLLELERRGLENVRVLRQDALELLEHGLPPASLAGVYLFFPDPWPKKRHHKRRIVQPAFIARLARVIRPGGLLHAATDWEPYAEHMLQVLDAADGLFGNSAGPGRFAPRPANRPLTRFERRGQRLGHGVYDLIYRRR
jgi:tRNA (guanine-N7-)-methyltransferase